MTTVFEKNKDIAEMILTQLGGHQFKVMTGAKELTVIENGLSLRIGKNHKSINKVRITLNANDLYDLSFEQVRMSKKTFDVTRKQIAAHSDIYFDQLQDVFTKETGMYTSLFGRR